MNSRLAWVLPALLAIAACKSKASQPPDARAGESSETPSGYEEAAYSTAIAPLQVCEHLAHMVAAEAGVSDPQIDPQMMAECERELTIEAAARGTSNWNGVAGCVLEARTGAELDACDRKYPLPSQAPPPGSAASAGSPTGDDSRERAACANMMEIIMLETAAEMGAVPEVTDAELAQLSDDCVNVLITEQRPNLSPADYGALLSCISSATTGDQIRQC
jgi:hypothetical protein